MSKQVKDQTISDKKLKFFNFDLKTETLKKAFKDIYDINKGNWYAIKPELEKEGFTPDLVKKLEFTHKLSQCGNNNQKFMDLFKGDENLKSLRDVALKYDKDTFIEKIKDSQKGSDKEKMLESQKLYNRLFLLESSAILINLIRNPKIPMLNNELGINIARVLENQADFDIRKTSVYELFKKNDALKDVPVELQNEVKSQFKILQPILTVSTIPDAIPVLYNAKLYSAFQISEIPPDRFKKIMLNKGLENAAIIQIHKNAQKTRVRNELALMAMREACRPTGIQVIDKSLIYASNINNGNAVDEMHIENGKTEFEKTAKKELEKNNLSWNLLFGDADFCECNECASLYSPASYFVDLLQYLRSNNEDTLNSKRITDTAVEKLFSRRPDLESLELTCQNTNTVLPYIDLVNEVMENYVALKQLKPFNVDDESTGELLSEPQHTEYKAYCILKNTVYPFTLPYHQPIDAIRIYLKHLGTSRYEMIKTFRENYKNDAPEIKDLKDEVLKRALDAEFLGLTKEEYIILTKECFEKKELIDKIKGKLHTEDEYRKLIGVRQVYEYYGYKDEPSMLSSSGLTKIKDEFLRRTGIDYKNLTELLKTEYINAYLPKGRSKVIMESLRFSYRFLQCYAKIHGIDRMADDLVNMEKTADLFLFLQEEINALTRGNTTVGPDVKEDKPEITGKDIKHWVKCNFEKIGRMIVVESGKECINGKILSRKKISTAKGIQNRTQLREYTSPLNEDDPKDYIEDCKIYINKESIGSIDKETGKITIKNPKFQPQTFLDWIFAGSNGEVGSFNILNGDLIPEEERGLYLIFLMQKDSCNLDTAVLQHLDGSPLESTEYDKIHRFLRLWRKLGWTIDEVDKAITGLSVQERIAPQDDLKNYASLCVTMNGDECNSDKCDECGDESCHPEYNINTELIHQLAAFKKLQEKTSLEVIKLLTFWTDISTSGEKSLYTSLFLKHNVLGIDKVFKADDNGIYLAGDEKITEHIPVIMASLNLSADEIQYIIDDAKLDGKLTIHNLSVIYRYRLLSKVLGLKIKDFISVLQIFGPVYKNADTTLGFLKQWTKMENAGFTWQQLNFILNKTDDEKKPFAPSKKNILQLAKTLYDGLNAIDIEHQDIKAGDTITEEELRKQNMLDRSSSDLVRTKASLIFDTETVEKIIGLLEGTSLYNTNAPKDLSINIGENKTLKKKLKYNSVEGSVQITGILTEAESDEFKSLNQDSKWADCLVRIGNQKNKLFQELLSGLSDKEKTLTPTQKEDLKKIILSGDFTVPVDQIPAGKADISTAPNKRLSFLTLFLPYLRQELTHRLIISVLAGYANLDSKITDVLISKILLQENKPIYDVFEKIKQSAKQDETNWSGYLIPPVNSDYIIIVKNQDSPPVIDFEGKKLDFKRQEDPNNEWWSGNNAIMAQLQSGKLYKISITGTDLKSIYWKTPTSSVSQIPLSAFMPDFASEDCKPALKALKMASILVSTFKLGVDEIEFLTKNNPKFDNLDFNSPTLVHCLRLEAYTRLRNSIPQTKINLLEFWNCIYNPSSDTDLIGKIVELTNWETEKIKKLVSPDHFGFEKPEDFKNEINLLKVQKALKVADKIAMDINLLFEWAIPLTKFKECRQIAESIRNTIRSRYNQTEWEQVAKPLHDQLRNNQKNALIAYLLQQDELIRWGVRDANNLFEYFLIDVQMEACMETSRIKQAISSVQLFIQRSFLGLESKIVDDKETGVAVGDLDRDRWDWMQRYRVWEANRKVFLYPENWIESNLRDDKSPFFKELESELLQKDINKQNVTDALKAYLYKVDEVANMEVVGLYVETKNSEGELTEDQKLHVFARTRNAPYFFYYRYFALDKMDWYPWEKVQVDIPSYDVENPATHEITGNGCYLTPVVWNKRLLLFFPQFIKKTKPNESSASKSFTDMSGDSPKSSKPIEYWEIKMAWSEYRNGKWTQKQLSKNAIYDIPEDSFAAAGTDFSKVADAVRNTQNQVSLADNNANTIIPETVKVLNSVDDIINKAEAAKAPAMAPGLALPYIDKVCDKAINTKNEAVAVNLLSITTKAKTASALDQANLAVNEVSNFETASKAAPNPISIISKYEFVPVFSDDEDKFLGIKVYYNNETEKGIFEFNGNSLEKSEKRYSGNNEVDVYSFHYNKDDYIVSLQVDDPTGYNYSRSSGVEDYYPPSRLYHSYVHDMFSKINSEPLKEFFQYNFSIDLLHFGQLDSGIYHELKRPYSLYNWELFFHTPVVLAEALSKSQQFEEAMKWFHFVFNPMAEAKDQDRNDLTPEMIDKRYWQFRPFREIDSQKILEKIFNNLQDDQVKEAVAEWRDNPFMPHLVARSRPVAYMKWVVMKYINNLIEWGDYLYRQDTIESINQATQLYILAFDILGPRPMMIPKRGRTKPQTYRSLLDKWDVLSNAMGELELVAPFSNQTELPVDIGNFIDNKELVFANIFGTASSLYFSIPNNPKLLEYWDTIEDRLYKIRHCQNISGVFRKLPLFEPPIDPGLLVKAAAQGLSLASVINDLNTPMPNYRFYYLLQKALELCGELKSLGGAMLSAIEKQDNEAVSLLRAKHEGVMNNMVMEIKKKQLEEAQKSLETLQQNRKAPEARMKYYLKLTGLEESLLPNENSEFSEIANAIATVNDDSGLKLIEFEKEEMDKSHLAHYTQLGASSIEALAGIFHALPDIAISAMPWGIGTKSEFGGSYFGNAATAASKVIQIISSQYSFESNNAGRKANFTRTLQERISQVNAAGYEIKQIDKQITAQQIRIDIANQEIKNHQQQIDNSIEVEEFLKNKYSNEELYKWMKDNLLTLYHQVYDFAYKIAQKAEKVYCFERGISCSKFIRAGYWDDGYCGLLSGEKLYLGLKQLELAYQENPGHDFEITKQISLRQINPLALFELKEKGFCEFFLPEALFDMDFPGHYKRRIKSVSLSIPCVVGPYTSINATLRLMENKFRNTSIGGKAYTESFEETDERFSTYNIPITAIAVSSGQNDSGVFELNFKDERYLPFEGAGVISKWRLELPTDFRQFNYDTISDVIMHMRYTSLEGGEKLKTASAGSLITSLESTADLSQQEGLFTIFELKTDFSSAWQKFNQPVLNGKREIELNGLDEKLPVFTKNRNAKATDIVLCSDADINAGSFIVSTTTNDYSFTQGKTKNTIVAATDIPIDDWKLKVSDGKTVYNKMWMVVRYLI